mmetsp:Transcript_41043/g.76811  ORF Transcript_41043/g.76811 Transcript_41043/m.76811 type:complete len:162 (+) Transcript_41043:2-487(+)
MDLCRELARRYNVEACVLTLHTFGNFTFYASHGLKPSVKPPQPGSGASFEFVFFHHHISRDLPIIVEDATMHLETKDQPLVTGEQKARFYAGAPLIWETGTYLGTLCIFDNAPRQFKMVDCAPLQEKAAECVHYFNQIESNDLSSRRGYHKDADAALATLS